jgi:hypothetical protein
MEHLGNDIHIRRIIFHHSNHKQAVWGGGLHGNDVPGSIDHTAYVEKYTVVARRWRCSAAALSHPTFTPPICR